MKTRIYSYIKILHLSDNFNEQIDLSKNLAHFTMGYSFNRYIHFPGTLSHFIRGAISINMSLDD